LKCPRYRMEQAIIYSSCWILILWNLLRSPVISPSSKLLHIWSADTQWRQTSLWYQFTNSNARNVIQIPD
jgi:hypothetical protein